MGPQLLKPTAQNKRAADEFPENFTPRGETNPIPALEAAFSQHPQVKDNGGVYRKVDETELND
jgi:hypothetical protein